VVQKPLIRVPGIITLRRVPVHGRVAIADVDDQDREGGGDARAGCVF